MQTRYASDFMEHVYLTPAQVSALLQIPQSTLAVWRCTGRVKLAYIKIGHAVRYRRSDVDAMLAANLHQA